MSTRSIIGTAHDGGFTGRYCHWDGYPTHRGPQLLDTYRELGKSWEAVRDYALKPNVTGYWSSYQPPSTYDGSKDNPSWQSTTGDGQVDSTQDCGAEWAYLLDAKGIHVLAFLHNDGTKAVGMFGSIGDGYWDSCGIVPWDATDVDWGKVDCGQELERCNHYAWVHFPEAKDFRISTDVWLGRRQPGYHDVHALVDVRTGRRLELSGSGGTGSATDSRDWNLPSTRPRYWWCAVKDAAQEVRAFRILKSGTKIEPRYRALVHTAKGEIAFEPGTVVATAPAGQLADVHLR